jgi:hypothetical protein
MAKYKEFDKYALVDDQDFVVDQSQFQDDLSGITARAHAIINDAREMSHAIRTLRAVNMDRLADELEAIQRRITATAEPISGVVMKELDAGIKHGQTMMGGLLMVGLKMAGQESEIARLKG